MELVNVKPLKTDEVYEKYTSYLGKEVRLIIQSFVLSDGEYEIDNGFNENLHWVPDIKIEIARIHHFDLQEVASKSKRLLGKSPKIMMRQWKTHFKVVDLMRHRKKKTYRQVKTISSYSNNSNYVPPFVPNRDMGMLQMVRRKSKYISRQLIIEANTSIKSESKFTQNLRISPTRSELRL